MVQNLIWVVKDTLNMLDFTSILNRVDSKSVVKCFGESKEKNITTNFLK